MFPAFTTLMNWGWVAGKVATSLRREALSWSHHALIASYPPDEQKKWLDKAEKWEWTVKKLGQRIYEAPDRRSEEERIYDNVRRWAWELEQETSQSWYVHLLGSLDIGFLSRLSSSYLQALADKCDETATWWANTRDKLRDFGAEVSRRERETWGEQEEADALHGASRTAAAASARAGAQQQIPSRRSHSSRRSSDSSPPRSKRAVIARPR